MNTSQPTRTTAPNAIRAAASVRGAEHVEQPLDEHDLDRPEQRRRQDHRLAGAEDDRSGLTGEPRLAGEHERDRGHVRRPEPLAQERDGEERDPDDERLVDEGGLRRVRAGEAFEEEDERDAAADARDGRDPEPLAPRRGPRGAASERARPGEQTAARARGGAPPATAFFAVV